MHLQEIREEKPVLAGNESLGSKSISGGYLIEKDSPCWKVLLGVGVPKTQCPVRDQMSRP